MFLRSKYVFNSVPKMLLCQEQSCAPRAGTRSHSFRDEAAALRLLKELFPFLPEVCGGAPPRLSLHHLLVL